MLEINGNQIKPLHIKIYLYYLVSAQAGLPDYPHKKNQWMTKEHALSYLFQREVRRNYVLAILICDLRYFDVIEKPDLSYRSKKTSKHGRPFNPEY